ncbi:polysaccharide biosynthesis protein [Streptococcus halitosis]|uniref:Polysaccharide biosynthesis protein n=1 Tax=Streptococcus halitosis TaxID=2172545 RepID=A0A3R8NV90_9STRE|nr:polysaccharide biosynthesis protein [Streptococcus halitosis]
MTTYFLKYSLVNDKMFFGMDEFRRVHKLFTILFTQAVLAIFHQKGKEILCKKISGGFRF